MVSKIFPNCRSWQVKTGFERFVR